MTANQEAVLEALREMYDEGRGVEPTARSLTDKLETRHYRTKRWNDGQVRSLLTRLEKGGHVNRIRDEKNRVRFRPVSTS